MISNYYNRLVSKINKKIFLIYFLSKKKKTNILPIHTNQTFGLDILLALIYKGCLSTQEQGPEPRCGSQFVESQVRMRAIVENHVTCESGILISPSIKAGKWLSGL